MRRRAQPGGKQERTNSLLRVVFWCVCAQVERRVGSLQSSLTHTNIRVLLCSHAPRSLALFKGVLQGAELASAHENVSDVVRLVS